MQNQIVKTLLLFGALVLAGCMEMQNPYSDGLNRLTVSAVYPSDHADATRAGVAVTVESVSGGSAYSLLTDASGTASTTLPNGIYRISISDRTGSDIFNGTLDKVVISGQDVAVSLSLKYSKAGTLVIKELYCGGCSKAPEEGTYQSDQYVILHNNDSQVLYLDGLCLGTLSPYNSTGSNPWLDGGELPDFLPIIQAIWQVGGTGTSFPLNPGEDAVICLRGAIDHSAQYPLSVNLNQPCYFVCYNQSYFPNPTYHPVPGDQIKSERILEVVIKTGQANAYTLSLNSPTFVIFRAEGTTMRDFVSVPENLRQVPGGSERVVTLPQEWVIDGMEVFNGGSSDNHKRLSPAIDAGYVALSETFKGHTLMRRVDETASAEQGFEVLMDTNNSTADFYERETQSLHK